MNLYRVISFELWRLYRDVSVVPERVGATRENTTVTHSPFFISWSSVIPRWMVSVA